MTSQKFAKQPKAFLARVFIGLLIGLFVIAISQEWFFKFDLLKNIELLTIDFRYQQKYNRASVKHNLAEKSDVVIVEISDRDLEALPEPFPFPRSYYAHVIENLNRAGAKVIVLDITFEASKDKFGDSIFQETLSKYTNIVLAAKVQAGAESEKYSVRKTERYYNNYFYRPGRYIGVVNVYKDRDDVCRSYFPMLDVNGFLTPSLAFATMNCMYKYKPEICPAVEKDYFVYKGLDIPRYQGTTFLLSFYGPVRTFPYYEFSKVIDDSSFKTKDEIVYETELNLFDDALSQKFKNKIVVIGSTMAEERDFHNIPLYIEEAGKRNYLMHGIEIHATAIQNILDGNFIFPADPSIELAIIMIFAVFGFLALLLLRQLHFKYVWLLEIVILGAVLVFLGLLFEVSIVLFMKENILLNIISPSLSIIFAYIGSTVYQYMKERQQKTFIKNMFGHYVSPTVVNELITNPEKATLGGDRRELTVFFSDIADFTSISEKYHHRPEQVVNLLNEYFDEMAAIIFKYDGTLDKYEGDAMVAFWGAPIPQTDHALRACYAAIEMQKRLETMRTKWKKESKPEIYVRIGINTGVMIVGNIGGQKRFNYTVIGDSVNLAARLETANKQYKSKIMISEFTYNLVKEKIIARELDLIQVQGKEEPVKVYEVLTTYKVGLTARQQQALDLYHEALQLYRERKWEEALAYMQQVQALDETCYAAKIYIERASLYRIAPPPSDWNGVFVMTTK